MKLVTREQFLKLPEGTIAMKYSQGSFDPLFVKGETWGNDFISTNIVDEIETTGSDDLIDKLTLLENGAEFPMAFEESMRDGCFDDKQLFAIWDKKDIEGLITKLNESLKEAY